MLKNFFIPSFLLSWFLLLGLPACSTQTAHHSQTELSDSRAGEVSEDSIQDSSSFDRLRKPAQIIDDNPVVIVGGGIAGLSAAYNLIQLGLVPHIYEASSRLGGRIYTRTTRDGYIIDEGGAFIDSDHDDLHQMIKDFNLPLYFIKEQTKLVQDIIFFNNKKYTSFELFKLFQPALKKIQQDMNQINKEKTVRKGQEEDAPSLTKTEMSINQMSIEEYFKSIKAPRLMTEITETLYLTEFGVELSQLNALTFFELIDINWKQNSVVLDGKIGDEAYSIKGGNGQLIEKLRHYIETHGGKIFYNHALVEIESDDQKEFELEFHKKKQSPRSQENLLQLKGMMNEAATEEKAEEDEGEVDVDAKHVILALPLPILQKKIKWEIKNFPQEKLHLINHFTQGSNYKFHLFFSKPFWVKNFRENNKNNKNELRNLGFTEITSKNFWVYDSTFNQMDKNFYSLTIFTGGEKAKRAAQMNGEEYKDEVLKELAPMFPGIELKEYYLSYEKGFPWPLNPWSQGSYTAGPKVGFWQLYDVLEDIQVGNLFFAGEFWNADHQGFINGAIASGKRAAQLIYKEVQAKN